MQQIAFYPPYFDIGAETSFDVAWEVFCCDLLNLKEGTSEIRRRTPPEQGVDLLWKGGRRVYQCKSVISGMAGGINITQTTSSLRDALAQKDVLGFTSIGLCTNVDLTGNQEAEIKKVVPEILLYTPGYWRAACEAHWNVASQRFRTFVSLSMKQTTDLVRMARVRSSVETLVARLEKPETFSLLVYSNRRRELLELPVSPEFTVEDVVRILMEAFKLPRATLFQHEEMSVSLSYSLTRSDQKTPLPFDQTLGKLGIGKDAAVTLWTTFVLKDHEDREANADVMEFKTFGGDGGWVTKRARRDAASSKFESIFNRAWDAAIERLQSESTGDAAEKDGADPSLERRPG